MNIFDILGPIMIGPSSSHTAGAVRIGKVARMILGEEVTQAKIELAGSFAETYKGHGTDKAILAGIQMMDTDDERIPDSLEWAKKSGISYQILTVEYLDEHPNTAQITLIGVSGNMVRVKASSIGGGRIRVTKIDDIEVSFEANENTLVIPHVDESGVIAQVTSILSQHEINIGRLVCNRTQRGKRAVMLIEVDGEINSEVIIDIEKCTGIEKCILIPEMK